MSENTPTPAELRAANQHGDDCAECVRAHAMADALEAVTAKHDALAAVIEETKAIVYEALSEADDSKLGWDAEVSASALRDVLETAPATALAQVKADAVRELKQVIFDGLNASGRARAHGMGILERIDGHAFSIERETQQ